MAPQLLDPLAGGWGGQQATESEAPWEKQVRGDEGLSMDLAVEVPLKPGHVLGAASCLRPRIANSSVLGFEAVPFALAVLCRHYLERHRCVSDLHSKVLRASLGSVRSWSE